MSPIEDTPFPRTGANAVSAGKGASQSLINLLGPTVRQKNGQPLNPADISEQVVGLYFSAHWCPPCRAFTPILSRVYTTARNQNKSLQIIFCSQDRSQPEFDAYWAQMPWPAMSFDRRDKVSLLAQLFNLRGIPSLLLLDSRSGVIISQSAAPGSELMWYADIGETRNVKSQPASEPSQQILKSDEVTGKSVDSVLSSLDDMPVEEKREGFATLVKLCQNLINEPSNAKYRVIKKSNKAVQKKVRALDDMQLPEQLADRRLIYLLKLSGFVEYEDRYEYQQSAVNDISIRVSSVEVYLSVQELESLLSCLLLSTEDSGEPDHSPDEQQNEPQRKDTDEQEKKDWVCDGDVCRRRT